MLSQRPMRDISALPVDLFVPPGRGRVVQGILAARETDGFVAYPGFAEAFPELFDAGYRVAFRLLGSRQDAAECAQEACARAVADWKKLSARGDVVPWVVRVSSHLAIDRWRGKHRVARRIVRSDSEAMIPERVDLYRAIESLSARQREVVVLRFLADLPEVTVAETLGCSLSTVKTHAARGLAALRVVLDIEEEPES
jgi:RNA polymerase sigma factor (sigma-70 family)